MCPSQVTFGRMRPLGDSSTSSFNLHARSDLHSSPHLCSISGQTRYSSTLDGSTCPCQTLLSLVRHHRLRPCGPYQRYDWGVIDCLLSYCRGCALRVYQSTYDATVSHWCAVHSNLSSITSLSAAVTVTSTITSFNSGSTQQL